jgi:hypothetical protein
LQAENGVLTFSSLRSPKVIQKSVPVKLIKTWVRESRVQCRVATRRVRRVVGEIRTGGPAWGRSKPSEMRRYTPAVSQRSGGTLEITIEWERWRWGHENEQSDTGSQLFFIRRRFFIQGPSAPPVRPIVGTMPLSPGDNNVERLNVFPSGLA